MKTLVIRQTAQYVISRPNHTIIICYRHGYVQVTETAGGVKEWLESHRANNSLAAENIMRQLVAKYEGM